MFVGELLRHSVQVIDLIFSGDYCLTYLVTSIGQRITINWNAQELSDLLSSVGLQNEVVQSYREFVEHPQAKEIDVFAWLKQAGSDDPWPVPNIPGIPNFTVGEVLSQSPTVGQHTRAVLAEFGYSDTEINNLYEQGIVA